jgi:hypothetical protein
MLELVQQLMAGAGVSEDQAEGGAGIIMRLLKDQLSSADFAQLGAEVPGTHELIDKAPEPGSGLGGMLGSVASALGGSQLGNLAAMADGFSQLGMDSGMIGKFVPIVVQFIQQQGGDRLAAMVAAVLKGD